MGLPGSGKSVYANKMAEDYHLHYPKVIHFDDFINSETGLVNLQDAWHTLNGENDNVIFDGLFIDNHQIAVAIASYLEYMCDDTDWGEYEYWAKVPINIEIHHWNEDRETCIKNDRGRRQLNSESDIRRMDYEDVDIDNIKHNIICNTSNVFKNITITTIEHTVKEYTRFEKLFQPWLDDSNNYEQHILTTNWWCTGGEWHDCWGGGGANRPDDPLEFTEFDKILETLCPNITFLQYKKIRSECVELENDTSHGYYGSYEYQSRWKCDLKELYNLLIDNNLLNTED